MQPTVKFSLYFFLFVFCLSNIQAQNTIARPETGVQYLSDLFQEIPFTTEQRNELMDKTIELVFLVSETGEAALEEVKGIENKVIVDRFYEQQSSVPKFIPQTQDGNPIASYFILEIAYISTQRERGIYKEGFPFFGSFKKEDFEFIETGKGRFESLLSGVGVGRFGDPRNQYQIGGGLKIDAVYVGKRGVGAGLTINFFNNEVTSDITEFGFTFDRSLTYMVGGMFICWLKWQPSPKAQIGWQVEINSALQEFQNNAAFGNIIAIQTNNFSPALGINYSLQIGNERYRNALFYVTGMTYHLNLHATVRPMITNFINPGTFVELGVGIRSQSRFVKDFQWKS